MLGENIVSGGERVCPDCNTDALTRLTGDNAVRTFCLCGPFSRESGYTTPQVADDAVREARARFALAPESEWPAILLDVLLARGIAR